MIREATHDDWADILWMGRTMHAESRFRDWAFDPVASRNTFETTLSIDGGVVLISHVDDEPAGFFLGLVMPHYFTSERFAADLAWYMLPEYRGHRDGLRMLNYFDEHARKHGCRELKINAGAGINNDRVGQLLERMGYTVDEVAYVKRY